MKENLVIDTENCQMKIKEVQAGIKITKNYNSYQASLTAELETGENPEKVGAELMEKALDIVKKKTGIDASKDTRDSAKPTINKRNEGIEVGGAWPDKKFANRLSVKDSRTGKWEDVNIENLEKIDGGYKQKTNEGTFIFRKLPKEKRTNNRMPWYRIYKIEE